MNEYKFSPLLFVQKDGKPIEFYMRSCSEKARLEPLIEKGGAVLHSYYRPGRVRLVEPGSRVMNLKDEEETISVQYVYDCIKRNRRLDKEKYRVTLKSMETSDISEDSGSIVGDSGAITTRSKRPRDELLKHQVTSKVRKFSKAYLERVSRFMLDNEEDFMSLSDMEFCKKLSRVLKRSLLEVSICYDHMLKNVSLIPIDRDVLEKLHVLLEKKIRKDFSRDDDLTILSYIFVNVCGSDTVCHNVWDAMRSEKDFLQPARSLWYRFNKVIVPNIHSYGLAPFKVQEIISKVEFLSRFDKESDDKFSEVDSLELRCRSLENGESFKKKARLEECERVIDAKLKTKQINSCKLPLKNSEVAVNGSHRSPMKGPCIINLCGGSENQNTQNFDVGNNNCSDGLTSSKVPAITIADVLKRKQDTKQSPSKDISPTSISETPEVEIDLQISKSSALQTSAAPKPVSQSSSDGSVVPPTYLQSQSKMADSQDSRTPASSQNKTVSLNDALINTGGFMPSNETENSRYANVVISTNDHSGFNPSQDEFPPSFHNRLDKGLGIITSANDDGNSNLPLSVNKNVCEKASSTETVSVPLSDKVPPTIDIMALDHSPIEHQNVMPNIKKCVPLGISPTENDGKLSVDLHKNQDDHRKRTNHTGVSQHKISTKEAVEEDYVRKKHKTHKKKTVVKETHKKITKKSDATSNVDSNVLNEASNSSTDSHMDDFEGLKRFLYQNFGTQMKESAATVPERPELMPQVTPSSSKCAKDGELEIVKQFLHDNFSKIEEISKKLITTTTTSSSDDQSQLTLTSSEGESNIAASKTSDKAKKLNKMLMQNTKYFEPLLNATTAKTSSGKIEELQRLLMQDTNNFELQEVNANNVPGADAHSADKCKNFEQLNRLLMQDTGCFDPMIGDNQSVQAVKVSGKATDDTANYETPECSLSLPGSNESSPDQLDFPKVNAAKSTFIGRHASWRESRVVSVSPATSGFRTADETICDDDIPAANDSTPPRNEDAPVIESENVFRSPSPSVVGRRYPLNLNTSMEVHPPLSTFGSDASTKPMDEDDEFDITFPSSRNTLNAGSQPIAVQSELEQDYPISEIDPFASTGSQQTVRSLSTKEMPIGKDREILTEAASIVKSLNNIVSSLNKNTSKNVPVGLKKQIEELSCKSFLPVLKLQVREIAKKTGHFTLEDKAVLAKYFSLCRQTPYHQLMCDMVNGL